jgi:hypothetical protein
MLQVANRIIDTSCRHTAKTHPACSSVHCCVCNLYLACMLKISMHGGLQAAACMGACPPVMKAAATPLRASSAVRALAYVAIFMPVMRMQAQLVGDAACIPVSRMCSRVDTHAAQCGAALHDVPRKPEMMEVIAPSRKAIVENRALKSAGARLLPASSCFQAVLKPSSEPSSTKMTTEKPTCCRTLTMASLHMALPYLMQ